MYKTIESKNGIRYMKDGKFIKKDNIPADVLIKLGVGMQDIVDAIVPEPTKCIFCGMATKQYRLLDSKPVYLCMDDYYDKSLGQVAQKVNNG